MVVLVAVGSITGTVMIGCGNDAGESEEEGRR